MPAFDWIHRQPALLGRRALPPRGLYLANSLASGVLTGAGLVIYGLYVVQDARLSPLELVLAGTALELAAFLGEVPTGMLADAVSRRLSVIIGLAITGLGFLVMGAHPSFLFIAGGQAIWGIGWTFRSGAQQAWLSDEIGELEAGRTFLRAAQLVEVGRLASIPLLVLLALIDLQAPFLATGALYVALAVANAFAMSERGYHPDAGDGGRWRALAAPSIEGSRVIRRRPVLVTLMVAAVLFGAWSESLDRLWPLHLIDNVGLPALARLGAPGWFGLIALGTMAGGIVVAELARRRVDIEDPRAISRALVLVTLLLVIAVLVFALTERFWLALTAYWLSGWVRVVHEPVRLAWINRGLEPRSRATVISMFSQADAIGQVGGGPGIGLLATARGVAPGLVTATLLLGAVLPLYRLAGRRDRASTEV